MLCPDVEELEIAERYLLGRLSDRERDEYEVHYLECESCFSSLQTLRAVQDELRLQPAAGARTAPGWFRLPVWLPAAAALFLLIGLGIRWRTHRSPPPVLASSSPETSSPAARSFPSPSPAVPTLDRLARVVPPPYVAVTLRGPEDHAHEEFRKAMQSYVKGDFGTAIGGLRSAATASPQTPAYSFYLGACYLLTHQVENAVDALGKTVSLGDSAYLESAHFLLAKAYLAEARVPEAKVELQATVRFRGSKEAEARDILGQLER